MSLLRLLPLLGTVLIPQTALAQSFEDLDALDSRIAQNLVGESAQALPLDRRLKLAACPAPAMIEPPAMGALTIRCPALGWRIRVPLQGAAMRAEWVIRRGDAVELAAGGPGFAVTTTVIAMDEGAYGKALRVKSPSSTVIVVATVTGPGTAALSR